MFTFRMKCKQLLEIHREAPPKPTLIGMERMVEQEGGREQERRNEKQKGESYENETNKDVFQVKLRIQDRLWR